MLVTSRCWWLYLDDNFWMYSQLDAIFLNDVLSNEKSLYLYESNEMTYSVWTIQIQTDDYNLRYKGFKCLHDKIKVSCLMKTNFMRSTIEIFFVAVSDVWFQVWNPLKVDCAGNNLYFRGCWRKQNKMNAMGHSWWNFWYTTLTENCCNRSCLGLVTLRCFYHHLRVYDASLIWSLRSHCRTWLCLRSMDLSDEGQCN